MFELVDNPYRNITSGFRSMTNYLRRKTSAQDLRLLGVYRHSMHMPEQWSFIVVRTRGFSLLRPEKSWRPIVTVTIDEQERHEILLGSDGQNPNLRAPFHLHDADTNSKVDIKVWHKPQSKKKSKKRNLVATACNSLGDLMKKHESETNVDIRLNGQLPLKRGCASKGKPQNGAFLVVRVRPPQSLMASPNGDSSSDSGLSEMLSAPPSPTDGTSSSLHSEDDQHATEGITSKKPRIRGYVISTDDYESDDEEDSEGFEKKPLLRDISPDEDTSEQCWDEEREDMIHINPESSGWLMTSMLPSYTEKIEVEPSMSLAERVFSSFSMYKEFKDATLDSHFEAVFTRLQQEWTYIGGLLVALAAVDTAVLSMSSGPGSLFNVDQFAKNSVAASSIASGVGISCDAWFLLRYNWADVHTFRMRARDLYGSYFFFSLSARLPSLSMLISAFSLMAFLGRVSYNAWPEAVIVICVLFGIAMTLQFLVFGVHWCARRVAGGTRAATREVVRVCGWISGKSSAPPPYDST